MKSSVRKRVCVPCTSAKSGVQLSSLPVKTFHKGLYERQSVVGSEMNGAKMKYQFVRVGWMCTVCGELVLDNEH